VEGQWAKHVLMADLFGAITCLSILHLHNYFLEYSVLYNLRQKRVIKLNEALLDYRALQAGV